MTEMFVDPKTKFTLALCVFRTMKRIAKSATIPISNSLTFDEAPRPAAFGFPSALGAGIGVGSVMPTRAYATAPAATAASGTSRGAAGGESVEDAALKVGQMRSGRIAQSPPRRK